MKRSNLIVVLVCLAGAVLVSTNASAMYHPRVGRFMQRDPLPGPATPMRADTTGPVIGGRFARREHRPQEIPSASAQYTDGMSLYQYAQSSPSTKLDPNGLLAVKVCVRPLGIFPSWLPWWASPANHAYIKMGGWTAGFQDDSIVHSPDLGPNHRGRKCWLSKKADKGKLPDGTTCKCATDAQIEKCVKDFAAKGAVKFGYGKYNVVTNNCGDWVINTKKRCCLKGKVPYHTYGPNHGSAE